MARENKSLVAALITSFAVIVVLVAALLFVLLSHNSNNTANASDTAQGQASTNGALQDCINNAHSQWDSLVASGETLNSPNFAQSNLDQAIAACHQQYGY